MVALVTLISALEPFFNWRARWVLMEETQYRLNRIRDEMDYYLVTTPAADLDPDRLHGGQARLTKIRLYARRALCALLSPGSHPNWQICVVP